MALGYRFRAVTPKGPNVVRVHSLPVRLVPMAFALGYLLVIGEGLVTARGWLWLALSCAVLLAVPRFPLLSVLAQCGLVLVAGRLDPPASDAVLLLLLVSAAELPVRRRGWPLALGVLAALAAVLLKLGNWRLDQAPPAFYLAVCSMVAAPVLLGLYIRSLRALAVAAQEHARDAEARVRTTERTALARELHDITAHHLSSIALRVTAARYAHPELGDPLSEVLDDVRQAATTSLRQVRQMLDLLRDPGMTDRELAPLLNPTNLAGALAELERTLREEFRVDWHVDDLSRVEAVQGLAVLRVTQESLTNVVKHGAPGGKVRVRVTTREDAVEVDILNSTRALAQTGTGWGLVGMRERVDLLGGTLLAGPTTEGWRVRALVPAVPS
ncbi:hypothetical protein KALB_2545 [Kutzneria albida DSM 43870]|uniref:histidine kinase n=1 Tax=Kutzneria albida DSM 43870 TaxID=1449976 RepID=W5W3V5_9PSEU|nr:hypothetical protein KALB_2545 [Kutzneria albida DSM 43870]